MLHKIRVVVAFDAFILHLISYVTCHAIIHFILLQVQANETVEKPNFESPDGGQVQRKDAMVWMELGEQSTRMDIADIVSQSQQSTYEFS